MRKAAWVEKLGKTCNFLTPQLVLFSLFRVFNGLLMFLAEIGLAFFLLTFFQRLQGDVPRSMTWFPVVDKMGFGAFLLCFCSLVLLKGGLEWAESYVARFSDEYFRGTQRKRLLEWLFYSRSVDQVQLVELFFPGIERSTIALGGAQVMLRQVVLIVPLLVTLFYLSVPLTLPLLGILLAVFFPIRMMARRARETGTLYYEHANHLHRRLVMTTRNLLLIRIHAMIEDEKTRVCSAVEGMLRASHRFAFASSTSGTYVYLVGTALVVVIGGISKRVSPEVVTLMIPYLYILNRLLTQTMFLVSQWPHFRFYYPSLSMLGKWWADHSHDGVRGRELYLRSSEKCFTEVQSPFGWSVKNIEFSFPQAKEPVFSGYSLDIPPGKATVLIGESGSGKSTLINLLIGEAFPTKGEIFVNHKGESFPIQACRDEVLSRIGYVGAESFLIGGTLRENLTYGLRREITENELKIAVQKAHCEFIFDHPLGFEHRLSDQGEGLSAGQKQRLCLARALLRNPKALILDEATANLDETTEAALVDTLASLKGQITMVCATHRKGFLRLADHVVELNKLPSSPKLRVAT